MKSNSSKRNDSAVERQNEELDNDLDNWEAKLLDDNNQPELYDTLEVLELRDNINKVARAVVVVNIALGIFNLQFTREMLLGAFPTMADMSGFLWELFIRALMVGVNIAVIYFPLKALTHILRILMEMEFNSRKARS